MVDVTTVICLAAYKSLGNESMNVDRLLDAVDAEYCHSVAATVVAMLDNSATTAIAAIAVQTTEITDIIATSIAFDMSPMFAVK